MSDRATEFDRMMNPWAYDADGNLTAAAKRQEAARTQINSTGAGAGGGGFSVDLAALDSAAATADQINGRLGGECQSADDEMAAVAGGLAGFGVGTACKDASATWDKQIQALSKVIGGLAQNVRSTAKNYRDANAAVAGTFKADGS
ncbi:WXG100 family type VII secretion target [Kitasatospora sp. NPDC057542]|uniref:WXG100 family type VII secretion target n=1 Tax=Kitasatospora sp. NPDC057542 TaxID=3346162 RepID=UPI00367F7E2E